MYKWKCIIPRMNENVSSPWMNENVSFSEWMNEKVSTAHPTWKIVNIWNIECMEMYEPLKACEKINGNVLITRSRSENVSTSKLISVAETAGASGAEIIWILEPEPKPKLSY